MLSFLKEERERYLIYEISDTSKCHIRSFLANVTGMGHEDLVDQVDWLLSQSVNGLIQFALNVTGLDNNDLKVLAGHVASCPVHLKMVDHLEDGWFLSATPDMTTYKCNVYSMLGPVKKITHLYQYNDARAEKKDPVNHVHTQARVSSPKV